MQWSWVHSGGILTMPNPVTIGNVLVEVQLMRVEASYPGPPTPPATAGPLSFFGPGAWTLLVGETPEPKVHFVRPGHSDNGGWAAVYAKVADSTSNVGDVTGSRNNSVLMYELNRTTLAGITVVYKDAQAGTTLDIGSLGTTTGQIALILAAYNGQAATTVTHANWTRDIHMDPWQGNFGGDTSVGGPFAGFSRGWFGHTITTGAALEAEVLISNSQVWCGIGVLIP